jgi:hypothetical protein
MSEQNNTCNRCGNNKEETGECFDCEIRPNMVYKECGICYESRYDKGFTHGFNCDHEVCGDCTIRITRCPFCRKPWKEEEEEEEEEEEDNREDVTILTTNEIRNILRNLTLITRRVTERLANAPDQPNRDAMMLLNDEMYRRIQQYRGIVRFQVRADGDFIQDNEGDWDFTTEHHAREIYDNVMEDIVEGTDSGLLNLQLTRTPALDEDDWNELFEGEAYPGLTICLEWNRHAEAQTEYRVEVRFVVDNDEDQDSVWVENEHGHVEFLNRDEAIAKYRELVVELAENRVYCRMPVKAVAVTRSMDGFREDDGEEIAVTNFLN